MSQAKYIQDCCLCGSLEIEEHNDLIKSPPANNLYSSRRESITANKYPLGLAVCTNCDHIQLSCEVDPVELFSNYTYKSGISVAFKRHFEMLSDKLISLFKTNNSELKVLDVGCNDGYLLDCFSKLGCKTYGFEPATNLISSISNNHIIYNDFFDENTIKQANLQDSIDIITANNVFAHTRNLSGFAKGVSQLLSDKGIFVFEVQYLLPLLNNCFFDMIYHEHTSYHHLNPLVKVLPKYGLHVFDAEIIETHGGSLRVYCSTSNHEFSKSVQEILDNESNLFSSYESTSAIITEFYDTVNIRLKSLSESINKYANAGKLVWGYTAPAKATTLLAGLSEEARNNINFIIDDAPLKQDKYIPGTSIPIISKNLISLESHFSEQPNIRNRYFENSIGIIFSWNIASSLKNNLIRERMGSGDFLVPLPKPIELNLF